jgi:maltose O-acetyltransferase
MSRLERVLRQAFDRWLRPDALADLKSRGLVVGRNFHLQQGVHLDPSHCHHITIGDDVTMAPDVHVLAHDASTKRHLGYTRIAKVDIGDRVFIGDSSIILPGVRIGSDVVIGAGSVVTRDIPEDSVACGNPASVVGPLRPWLERKKREMSAVPCFGEEYTVRRGVTEAMRSDMNDRMEGRVGYIV